MTDRRAEGRFYTPAPVVRYIVRRTLDLAAGRSPAELRIVEPACGAGVFLQEAYRWLRDAVPRAPDCRLLGGLFGLDCDPHAVAAARRTLAGEVGSGNAGRIPGLHDLLAHNLREGNALIGSDFFHAAGQGSAAGPGSGAGRGSPDPALPVAFDWQREFPEVFSGPAGGFDAVIGNPPYVNIRRLTSHHGPQIKRYLRSRFRCARGAYDLYVLFFELAWQLLRPGGLCGMIVPNKIATLNYAAACRLLLQEHTSLLEISDLSGCRVFPDAGVYPYVLIWRKEPPAEHHRLAVISIPSLTALSSAAVARRVVQSRLVSQDGWHLHGSLDVEARVPTQPLREVAQVHSGTTGFQAAQVAELLRERQTDSPDSGLEFVVTGNIDRYVIRPGHVRFMNRRFARPVLPEDAGGLTTRKRGLYRGAKILVGGMSLRLEAAWDPGGLALGVQLYAAVPSIDPHYLLALLNSKLISYLFRLRFQAKRLSGKYLSVNKGQLAAVPIRRIDAGCGEECHCAVELAALARQMIALVPAACQPGPEGQSLRIRQRSLDRQIDQLVYRLYGLTGEEIERAEAEYPEQPQSTPAGSPGR